MTTIKTFSLTIALLSACNLFTMKHGDHEYLALKSETGLGVKKVDKPQDDTLCKIWERIDKEYVEVDDYVISMGEPFRSLVGSCLSYYKGRQMKPKQAKKVLDQIESWIKSYITIERHQRSIFENFVANHWYVNYAMKALVSSNIEDVTGFTIDAVYSNYENIDKNSMSSAVFYNAYKTFFENNLSKKKLIDIMPKVMSDIHFTVLYHPHGNVKPHSLKMSSCGKYLKATDVHGTPCTWNMQTGKIVDIYEIESGQIVDIYEIEVDRWIPGKTEVQEAVFGAYSCAEMDRYRVIDKNDNYCARVSDSYVTVDAQFFPREIINNPKAIIVFARPGIQSYLGQKAFDNSFMNIAEMKALLNSKVCKSLDGFVKNNLTRVTENHIQQLTITNQMFDGK